MNKPTLKLSLIFLLLSWVVFSFTQVDLNLTLVSNPLYLSLQKNLTFLGYFKRPLNTGFYLLIYLFFSVFYVLVSYQVLKNKLDLKTIKNLVLLTGLILTFSYPALSHDIFNYIFDAKILGFYHQNPYLHSAQDFSQDLWTRFMHWTHRTYPYGPSWLLLTLPFLFLGLGKFSLTLFWFKVLNTLSYFLSAFFIYKICKKTKLSNPSLSLALFAFNPLVVTEGLISGHLDLTMSALFLASVWFLINKKFLKSGILWLVSAGVKFVTLVNLPVFFKKWSFKTRVLAATVLSFLAIAIYSIYKEPQPWYWVLPFSTAILLPLKNYLKRFLVVLSLLQPLTYLPYLYLGDYAYPKLWVKWGMLALSLLILGLISIQKKLLKNEA